MQVIDRPQQLTRTFRRETQAPAAVRAATLVALSQRHSSGYSREFVRANVLSWAARKWPELLIGRDPCGLRFESHSSSAGVEVTCAEDGDYAWSFKGTRPDAVAARVWETRVLVFGAGDRDLLTVRTGYTGTSTLTVPCAQPKFLGSLIEHLSFHDGNHLVGVLPEQVCGADAFDNFLDHLFSRRRTLPILAVPCEMPSEDKTRQPPDPASLARKLCGLVHVVSLDPWGVARLEQRLGRRMAVHAGEARLFMPGFEADADPDGHPCFTALQAPHLAATDVETAAQAATHAWSTSPSRDENFEALWAITVGA